MPLVDVLLTDTFDQWRQKTNSLIDTINALGSNGDIFSVSTPTTGQILVYNGTMFANVTMSGDMTINSAGVATVSGVALGGLTKGRIRFAGSMSSLF